MAGAVPAANQYTYHEMRQILAHRVQLAFKPEVVPEETIDLIAGIAYQRQDLRHGLDILYRTGCDIDQKRLTRITPKLMQCMSSRGSE